jgi:hypothetical protein
MTTTLTVAGVIAARQAAQALLEAADEMDRWVRQLNG